MRTVTRLSQLTVAAALGLSLAACGSSSSTGGTTSAAAPSGQSSSAAASSAAASPSSSTPSSAASSSDAAVPSATALIHQARAAYPKAKSAHLHLRINTSTEHQTIDIKGTIDGTNQEVHISQRGKGSAILRTVAGKTYINADRTFWMTSGGLTKNIAALAAGKWIIAPASASGQFSSVSIKKFLDGVLGADTMTDSDLAKASSKKSSLAGKPVYVITDDSADGGTLTLAADTKYLLRLLPSADKRDEGAMTIVGWDQQPTVSAPSGAVDANSLR